MKPAPATSPARSSGLAGSAATIAAASSRGLRPARLRQPQRDVAGEVAMLRVARALDDDPARSDGRRRAARALQLRAAPRASSCFELVLSRRASLAEIAAFAGLPAKRRLTADVERIHVQRPAHAARRPAARSTAGSQPLEEAAAARRARRLSTSSCAWWRPGAPRHRRRHRPAAGARRGGRPARPRARPRRKSQRRGAALAPRRAAAPAARTAASARRRARPAPLAAKPS